MQCWTFDIFVNISRFEQFFSLTTSGSFPQVEPSNYEHEECNNPVIKPTTRQAYNQSTRQPDTQTTKRTHDSSPFSETQPARPPSLVFLSVASLDETVRFAAAVDKVAAFGLLIGFYWGYYCIFIGGQSGCNWGY